MPFPFLTSTRVYQWTVRGMADGQSILNVYHGNVETPGGDPIAENTFTFRQLNEALRAWNRANILPLVGSNLRVERYDIAELLFSGVNPDLSRRITTGFPDELAGDPESDIGSLDAPFLPTYVAASAVLKGQVLGTVVRGGKRWGTLAEAQTEDAGGNTLTAAAANAFTTVVDAMPFFLAVVAGQVVWNWRVFARRQAELGDDPDMALYSTRILTGNVNPFVGSQVSRKRGRAGGS